MNALHHGHYRISLFLYQTSGYGPDDPSEAVLAIHAFVRRLRQISEAAQHISVILDKVRSV